MAILLERNNTSGRREDLADLISLVDAKDTPFTSMAKKGAQPGNVLFRWQADSLPEPRTTGIMDGKDVVLSTDAENYVKDGGVTYRAELSNYIQIFRRTVRVSKLTTNPVTNIAGVKSELSNNVEKGIKMLKRDIEKTLCGTNGAQAEAIVGGNDRPYLTRGLDKWVENIANKDATLPVPDAFCTPSGSILRAAGGHSTANLDEIKVQDVLQSMFEQSGRFQDLDLLGGTKLKRAFTNLLYTTKGEDDTSQSVIRTLNRNSEDNVYRSTVDVFEGDFGRLRIHVSQFLKNSFSGYIIPFDMVEIKYGGQVAEVTELPDFGGGPARNIEAVLALCVHNPLAFGKFDFTA
jgi:hypothetical protein